jgi:hypothetical protein
VLDTSYRPAGAEPHRGAPAFADFDNDGRADLFVPLQSDGATSFEWLRSRRAGALSSEEAFEEGLPFGIEIAAGAGTLHFSISTKDFAPAATHVEVLAWTQADAQAYLDTSSDGPARLYEIDPGQQQELAPAWEVYGLTLPVATDPCDMPIRWLEVRLVQLDANGVLVRAWPTYVCAIAARRADQCALDHGLTTNEEIVLDPGFSCLGAACDSAAEAGNWPAEGVTRRRKADPPPGVPPARQVPPVVVGPIPAPPVGGG